MRTLYLLKSLFLLAVLSMGVCSASAQTTYHLEKVTSVEAGGLYVFEQSGRVMSNTISSDALQTTVSYNTEDLSGTESYVWTLEPVTDGFKMKNVSLSSNPYLTNTSGTDVSFGNGTTWVFNFQQDETVLIQNIDNGNRFLGFNASNNYKAYDTSTNSAHAIVVYQLIEDTNSPKDPQLSVEDIRVALGATIDLEVSTKSSGAITYTITDGTIASIADGKVTGLMSGSTTVTATQAAVGGTWASASTQFTVTTIPSVNPAGYDLPTGYVLVTDASTLTDGDKIIIVGKANNNADCAIGTQRTNNFGATAVTITNNTIAEISNTVKVFTLEGSANAWYFNLNGSYLYAASSDNNYLKTASKSTAGNNGKAKITINSSTGAATITFQGANKRNIIRCNPGANANGPVSDVIFSCYSSGEQDIYIYRKSTANTFDVTIGATGWRTLVSAHNVSLPEGVKAYTVTESDASSATLTEVTSIKANNAYLLNGPAGDYTLTIIDSPEEPTGNLLQVSTETTGNGVYVLANKSNGVGFYRWSGGSLGAGRVYLPAPANGSREYIVFEESTGVNDVRSKKEDVRGEVYDLQGRRVAQPSKGLYIMNGKTVIIK